MIGIIGGDEVRRNGVRHENMVGFTALGDSGVVKDKAEPNKPCLTVYLPTSALGSLPSVALSSGWAKQL